MNWMEISQSMFQAVFFFIICKLYFVHGVGRLENQSKHWRITKLELNNVVGKSHRSYFGRYHK